MLVNSPNSPYWPNKRPLSLSPGTVDWRCVAADGSLHTTVAVLLAAGKRHFGDLGPGGRLGACLLHSVNAAGTGAGSGVLYKRNTLTTPTLATEADNLVGGSDQQISLDCPFKVLWVKNIVAGDLIKTEAAY